MSYYNIHLLIDDNLTKKSDDEFDDQENALEALVAQLQKVMKSNTAKKQKHQEKLMLDAEEDMNKLFSQYKSRRANARDKLKQETAQKLGSVKDKSNGLFNCIIG